MVLARSLETAYMGQSLMIFHFALHSTELELAELELAELVS